MNVKKTAMLFPGQGAWYPGVLEQAATAFPQIGSVMAAVDAVSLRRFGHTVSERIWRKEAATTEALLADSPGAVQLAIFSTSVALYRCLTAEGLQPGVLMGHSFGEIAALVCAGAFTVEQGAEIVCDRTEATQLATGGGYMAALGADAAKAETLLAMIGDPGTVVAGENGETQTVLSGTPEGMDRAAAVAKALNLPFVRLNSPYAFHSPSMAAARAEFARRLDRVQPAATAVPVFSPILGRYYAPADRLTTCLADHLVQRVRFADALRQLHADGIGAIVECGALNALTKLARTAAPAAGLTAVACLTGDGDEIGSLTRALDALTADGRIRGRSTPAPIGIAGGLAPAALVPADAAGFWKDRGDAIRQFLDEQYATFRASRRAAEPVARAHATIVEFPAAMPAPARPGIDRAGVFRHLTTVYAAALEYPEEVFAEHVDLEAELGIDSVKQTELLARVSEEYTLPPRPADFRLSNYNTLGKVADLIVSKLAAAEVAAPAPPARVRAEAPAPTRSRNDLFAAIVSMYTAALEYPEEVFTPDVALEAELGIDSVKQTELLARLSEQHGLPPRPADFRLSNYDTLRKVTDFVFGAMRGGVPADSDSSREFDGGPVARLASRAAQAGVAVQ